MALLTLVLTLPIALTSSPTRFVGHRPTHVSLNLALRPSFLFSVGAAFLQAGGNGVPITFVAEYSVALGYSSTKAAGWLAVMNAVNSVSRVGTGWVGDKWGRQNVLIGMVVASVVCVGALWGGSAVEKDGGKGLWIAFVVVYGMAGGGYNALFPTVFES
jgi:nitrate/nitrite transporter NarK